MYLFSFIGVHFQYTAYRSDKINSNVGQYNFDWIYRTDDDNACNFQITMQSLSNWDMTTKDLTNVSPEKSMVSKFHIAGNEF